MTASGSRPPVVARWREWEGDGVQHLVLRQASGKTIAEAAVLASEEGKRFAARFRITCDEAWRALRLEAQVIGDDRRIDLIGDGAGHWTDGAGKRLAASRWRHRRRSAADAFHQYPADPPAEA